MNVIFANSPVTVYFYPVSVTVDGFETIITWHILVIEEEQA